MNSLWWRQIEAIVRLELKKTFFARRGLWIYMLALAPVALFTAQAVVERHFRGETHDAPSSVRRISDDDLGSVHPGMSGNEVIAKFGPPQWNRSFDRAT
jgi:hypothetical protein